MEKKGGNGGLERSFMACPSENYLPSHLRTQPQRPSSFLCNITTVYDTTRFFSSRLMAVMYIVNLAKHSRK